MRVLLYAPVDLNLIDGSAIWCASVAQVLALEPAARIDVLLHAPLRRTINTAGWADGRRVRLRDPWRADDPVLGRQRGRLGPRLTPEQACARLADLHAAEPCDLLIVRGGPVCQQLAGEPRLAARSWFYLTQHAADVATIAALARCNGRIACQTPLLQEFLEGLLGTGPQRYVPLPPMVPRLRCPRPRAGRSGRRLCYVGKFEPDYRVEELLAALGPLRARWPDAELVVAGDKFHDPDGGGFERRVRAALAATPGVVWRGGLPREAVGELMAACDLGACWRTERYDGSLELSTKALEYAAAGLPVLLNPTRINRLVFGDDYPLYAATPAEFSERLAAALDDPRVYARAAERAFDVCRSYTFAAVAERLRPYLAEHAPARARPRRRPLRVLFAGHDFKFCREIMGHLERRPDCLVRADRWGGHDHHDERASAELLRWADVVWCEWCLGNAVWYSARVRPAQRLIVRVHRQELTTAFPARVSWAGVSHLVFIAGHVRAALRERLGDVLAGVDTRLIYNTFDCAALARPKTAGAERRLGLLGCCPRLKHPRLAAEIVGHLRAHDPRWTLVLAGHPPQHYPWLWERPEERAYYEAFEAYVAASGLERHIVRQAWTDDTAEWYRGVGYILSCSDLEGSHQAVAEGMAAGCVPVVRRWPGAAELYPRALLFDTAAEAAELIRRCADSQRHAAAAQSAQAEAQQRFDLSVVLPQLEALVLGTVAEDTAAPAAPAGGGAPEPTRTARS